MDGLVERWPADFVGRQRVMDSLRIALEEACSGRGRLVALAGEPGIGKTRTATEFASYARERGATLLFSKCYDAHGAPPYWLWVQPLRSYIQETGLDHLLSEIGRDLQELSEILAELREHLPDSQPPALLDPGDARFRLFDSLASFLKHASLARPLVLILDNLHWADTPSLLFLGFLAHHLADSRVLVLATYRDTTMPQQHTLSQVLGSIASEPVFRHITLKRLEQPDVTVFIKSAVGVEPPPNLVQAVYEKTGGNPFFMTQVVRMLAQEGNLAPGALSDRQRWDIRIPDDLRMVIGRRLERLSDRAVRLLRAASVIGSEFEFRHLRLLFKDLSLEEMVTALEEALADRIIEETPGAPGTYRFIHGIMQHALADQLSSTRRAWLHASIGEALEHHYGDQAATHATELAYHFSEASSVTEPEKLIKYSLLAGEQALAAYAYENALAHFERAWRARAKAGATASPQEARQAHAEAAAILFGLGKAQLATLSLAEAQRTLAEAFESYLQAGDTEAALAVATYPQTMWDLMGLTDLYARALQLARPGSHEAGLVLSRYGWSLGVAKGDYEGAQQAFRDAVQIAKREGNESLVVRTLARAACVEAHHLRFREALEKCHKAIRLGQAIGDLQSAQLARMWAAMALRFMGDLDAADHQASSLLRTAQDVSDRVWTKTAFYHKQMIAHMRGDWQAARQFSDSGLAIAPDDPRLLAARAMLEYEQSCDPAGEAYIERLLQVAPSTASEKIVRQASLAIALPLACRVSCKAGRYELAQELAESLLAMPNVTPYYALLARIGLALVAVQKEDSELAAAQYSALVSRRGSVASLVSMDRLLGLLALTMGRLEDALSHLQEAVDYCAQAGLLVEQAWALHDLSDALLRRGSPDDQRQAMAEISQGLSIACAVGMKRLEQRLKSLREEVAGSGGGKAVCGLPDGLTQREIEVLRLIAQGRSNRAIADELVISLNTVMHHVSSILCKTSSANRAEAATYAVRKGII